MYTLILYYSLFAVVQLFKTSVLTHVRSLHTLNVCTVQDLRYDKELQYTLKLVGMTRVTLSNRL